MVASNRYFLLKGSIFRGYVGFGEGNLQTEEEGSFAGDFVAGDIDIAWRLPRGSFHKKAGG